MRVLLISPLPPPEGGIATFTLQYRRYCEQNDMDLTVVNTALKGSRLENFNNKRKYSDEIKRAKTIFCDLKNGIKEKRPDFVHLNTSCGRHGLIRDALCFYLCRRKKIPVVMHCHCNVEDQLGNGKWIRRLFSWMVNQSHRVITINTPSKDFVSQFVKGSLEKIYLVPNFMDTEHLIPPVEIRSSIRQVCFLGHVQFQKGIREILEIAPCFPDITFTFIGSVAKEVEVLQPPSNVCFFGQKTQEEAMQLLRQADVFLFPSYTEGFSIALLEAMSVGLPVIASDVGANRDMIESQGGIIVPVENSQALADALKQIEDSNIRKAMSDWNVKKVKEYYSMETVMQQLVSICQFTDKEKM